MMPTLQDRVRRVASQARQLVRLYGIGWFVACVGLAALTVGAIDYLVRFEDVGIRVICFIILCATAAWSFARFVIVAWRYRCSELQAARHIERYYPALDDRLTSAVAFAADALGDDDAGSIELRRAVIAETEVATEALDFERCFDRRQPMRALVAALFSIGAIAILFWVDSPSVSLAARRMLVPWSHHPWPRRHVLQWQDTPTRLAVGQDFEARLTDANGRLPDRVEIHYWFEGDSLAEVQTFSMQPLGDRMVHRLAGITRPFRYRATGGDDQKMPWTALSLVEPPRIVEREVELHPPAYAGLATRRVDGSFQALIGTRATVRVRTSKPLSAAWLETDTMHDAATVELQLDDDRRGFALNDAEADWTIVRSGSYGFRLFARDGLDVGVPDQWEVHAIRDLPPTVSLRRPATDLRITAAAQLPIEAIVKDDLAVRRVELHFVRSTAVDQEAEHFSLWDGSDQVVAESGRATSDGDQGMQRTVKQRWDLTRIPAMKPGEWIDFRVIAVDYKQQVGESATRRLTFISSEELQERIAQRQSELLAEIAEVLRLQRSTHAQVADLKIQVREASNLEQEDSDQLQVAELNQRQVRQRLGHPSDGVAAQIVGLIDEARNNRLEDSELLTRLQQFHQTIQQLNRGALAAIQHPLVDAVRIVRESPTTGQNATRQIDRAGQRELIGLFDQVDVSQRQVIETLERLLGRMEQWDNYQRLAREVGRLKREQENVSARTRQLRIETLATDPNDLDTQQRSAVKRLAQRQNDIGLRFGALASGMETARRKLVADDPTAAATLADALDMVRQGGISGRMRDVGREMERIRLGQAADQQEAVIKLLTELQDILANRREYQLDRQVDRLRAAANQLEQIVSRQQTLSKETESALAATADQFRKWQQEEAELSHQTQTLARQMQRQDADSAAAATLKAGGQCLGGACQAAGAKDLAKTRRQAKDALAKLDEARNQVKQALAEARESLRDQRIGNLRPAVRAFLSRQQRLIDETQQAETERQAGPDSETARWRQVVQGLADDQTTLSEEIDEVALRLADVAAFAFALQRTVDCMVSAGQCLQGSDTGIETVELQRRAMEYLQQVLGAMATDAPREQQEDDQAKPSKGPGGKKKNRAAKYMLAQLKLVRALQQQVNRETELLARNEGAWDVARQQDLVQQQRRLAEIVLQLLEADTGAGTDAIERDPAPPPVDQLESLDRALEQDGT